MRRLDIVAGALLLNSIPHAIMGLAGKRLMTPVSGPNSSPAANLAWSGLNILVGTAALAPSTWRSAGQRIAEERLRAVTVGMAAMACFAPAYELSPGGARGRALRADAAVGSTRSR